MCREILGTRDDQVFQFRYKPAIQDFRVVEPKKIPSGRRKKIIFLPPKQQTKNYGKSN